MVYSITSPYHLQIWDNENLREVQNCECHEHPIFHYIEIYDQVKNRKRESIEELNDEIDTQINQIQNFESKKTLLEFE